MERLKRSTSGWSTTSEASRASGRSESSVSTVTTQRANRADRWSEAMLARLNTCGDELERALSNTFFTNREAWSQSCGISLDQLADDLEVLKSRSRHTFETNFREAVDLCSESIREGGATPTEEIGFLRSATLKTVADRVQICAASEVSIGGHRIRGFDRLTYAPIAGSTDKKSKYSTSIEATPRPTSVGQE